MNKKTFVSVANLCLNTVVDMTSAKKDRLYREYTSLQKEIVGELKELALGWKERSGSKPNVYVDFSPKGEVSASRCTELEVDIPPELQEKIHRYTILRTEYNNVPRRWVIKRDITAWKLAALSKETLNHEPFPAEYWDYLTPTIQNMLTKEETENENNTEEV